MVAAGVRAFVVNRAASRRAFNVDTVVVSLAGQRVNGAFEVEVIDDAGLDKPSGYFFWGVICFERVDDLHAH